LIIVYIALYFILSLGVYGAYKKAAPQGEPAWAAFVPIYSFIVLLRVAGRPATWAWFLLLALVPFIGGLALLVVSIIVLNDVSKSFGHGAGFTVGLVLLSVIFWYILWLGQSQYRGPAGPAALGGVFGGGGGSGAGYGNQYPAVPGYPPQQPGYPPQQPGYPPQGYPQQPGYPPQGYPQQPGYPPQPGQAPAPPPPPTYPPQGPVPGQAPPPSPPAYPPQGPVPGQAPPQPPPAYPPQGPAPGQAPPPSPPPGQVTPPD
jgi:hypothetical protein